MTNRNPADRRAQQFNQKPLAIRHVFRIYLTDPHQLTMKQSLASTLALALAVGASTSAPASVVIDWVTIGNPGNAAQSAANRTAFESGGDGYGAVADTFRISRNETTITEYTAFLNAVATTDPYNLYNPAMGWNSDIAGISRSGAPGSYTYSVIGSGNRPITYVSWFDAARYTNWLHNGQGSGGTETGAYTLNGAISGTAPAKNVGATVWIPTENECFKAAYFDPTKGSSGGYWLHANQNDFMTTNTIGDAAAANYFDFIFFAKDVNGLPSYLTGAGAYGTSSQSYYGINDMAGNVREWNDLNAESGSSRGLRGGSWLSIESDLSSSSRTVITPEYEHQAVGFRVASIPEPSTMVLTMLFSAGLLCRRRR